MPSPAEVLLAGITISVGSVVLAHWSYRLFHFVRTHFTSKPVSLRRFGARAGAWAVVTGATSGIGKAYAAELARSGFNVFLMARDEGRLQATRELLECKYGVECRTLALDFASAGPEQYAEVEGRLHALPRLGLLVNNVGANYEHADYFHATPSALDNELIAVNVTSTTRMTKLALTLAPPAKDTAIVNVGSVYGTVPAPLLAVYSGTKAYIEMFTRALDAEHSGKRFVFQCVTPGLVATKMSRTQPSRAVAEPTTIAAASLARLGQELVLSPYWFHAATQAVLRRLPAGRRGASMLQSNLQIRAVALKKKQLRAERRATRRAPSV